MGFVYKARDERLDRFVCIKVLRSEPFKDRQRKQRFIQEAKAASSLNHPNIITIFEIDEANGADFIVMEYVPGKTLQQVIANGPLPLAEALKIAIQIAGALAAANSAGIVHRDVKPANVVVGTNGVVKVLDFGLAKLAAPDDQPPNGRTRTIQDTTEEGVILGTAAYMSPEQAQGKPVDARSDIFSLGAVLYEMLTGHRAFEAANRMSTLAAILNQEPVPPSELEAAIPKELERIVMRCLRKDPDRRFQHMSDLKVALEELKEESDSGKLTAPTVPNAIQRPHSPLVFLALAGLVVLAAASSWFWWTAKPRQPAQHTLMRLTSTGLAINPAISLDGKLLAYQSSLGGLDPQIWIQQIGSGNAIPITHEKDGALSPVFSPDGTRVAYESRSALYEVPTLGGPPRMIVSYGVGPSYTRDGSSIVFSKSEADCFLFRIPATGGPPVPIRPDLEIQSRPALSPDGGRILVSGGRKGHAEDISRWWMIDLQTGSLDPIAAPSLSLDPLLWISSAQRSREWVIFGKKTGDTYNLFRVPLTANGKRAGEPEQLTYTTGFAENPSVSEDGKLVFDSGTATTNLWSIPIDTNRAHVTGERQSITQAEGVSNDSPSLSRDGKMLAYFSNNRLMVRHLDTSQETQLLAHINVIEGTRSSISPDGAMVAYYDHKTSQADPDINVISTAGGPARRVCSVCGFPQGFSSDGKWFLTENSYRSTGRDRIGLVELATGKAREVASDPDHSLWNPYYSWDDKWMTFLMETGPNRYRIYITPVDNLIPAGPERWIQLTNGDYQDNKPQFSPDGNTIYFTSNRDGPICLWALRLDPTKHPLGDPFVVQHFLGVQRIYTGISHPHHMEVNIAKDRIITNLDEYHTDIWMLQLDR